MERNKMEVAILYYYTIKKKKGKKIIKNNKKEQKLTSFFAWAATLSRGLLASVGSYEAHA